MQNISVLILMANVWPLSSAFWASLPIAAFLQINAKTFISFFLGNLAHLQHLKVQNNYFHVHLKVIFLV